MQYLHDILSFNGRDMDQAVANLTAADYFKTHPKVRDGIDISDSEPEDQRIVVKRRITLFADFLQAHPEFVERERLEWYLGLLYLADGRMQDAANSFAWLNANAKSKDAKERGSQLLLSMQKRNLVAPPPSPK